MASSSTLRSRLYAVLEHGDGPYGTSTQICIAGLILLSACMLPLEYLHAFEQERPLLLSIEAIITALFTVEYLFRIYAAPQRIRYIFSLAGIIDLLAILPFYLALLDTRLLRLLRLARLARIFKIAKYHTLIRHQHHIHLLPNEHILHITHRHPIFFTAALIPAGILLLISISLAIILPHIIGISVLISTYGIALLLSLRGWISYAHDAVYLTTHRLIIAEGGHLFGTHEHEVFLNDISDVSLSQSGVIATYCNYGDITIETSSGRRAIALPLLADPNVTLERIEEAKNALST